MDDYPRTTLQKTLLILLLVMAVVFGVLTAWFQGHPGVSFRGTMLYPSREGDAAVYTGRIHGKTVSIACRPDGAGTVVDLTEDGGLVHACRVDYPEGTVTDGDGDVWPRVEITRDGETLFQGAYNPYASGFPTLYDEGGEWHAPITIVVGNAEPDFGEFDIFRFARGPELVRRGSWMAWALAALLLSGIAALAVAFPMALFRFNHFLSVKDPEPTEFYLYMQKVGWVLFTAFILGVYIWGLTIID